jgi:hypothetical protein
MNLTKGKITKLYNKKNQSLKKKINKKRTSNKSKTFRRKRNLNLARKSLKRFHHKKYGGEGKKDGKQVEDDTGIELTDIKLEDNNVAPLASTAQEVLTNKMPDLNAVADSITTAQAAAETQGTTNGQVELANSQIVEANTPVETNEQAEGVTNEQAEGVTNEQAEGVTNEQAEGVTNEQI